LGLPVSEPGVPRGAAPVPGLPARTPAPGVRSTPAARDAATVGAACGPAHPQVGGRGAARACPGTGHAMDLAGAADRGRFLLAHVVLTRRCNPGRPAGSLCRSFVSGFRYPLF